MKRNKTLEIATGGIIAALYVALTFVAQAFGMASGAIQLRLSEALTILPCFTVSAVPGLTVGCVLANLLTGCAPWDVVFGSLATLIGAVGGYLLRRNRWLVPLPTILANGIIVPFVLRYGYQAPLSIPLMMAYVAVGEIISCYGLGELLCSVLLRHKHIFGTRKTEGQSDK